MTVNIKKMRVDMAFQNKQLAWETRRFMISGLVAAALVGAGAALGNYLAKQPGPPIVIQLQQPLVAAPTR